MRHEYSPLSNDPSTPLLECVDSDITSARGNVQSYGLRIKFVVLTLLLSLELMLRELIACKFGKYRYSILILFPLGSCIISFFLLFFNLDNDLLHGKMTVSLRVKHLATIAVLNVTSRILLFLPLGLLPGYICFIFQDTSLAVSATIAYFSRMSRVITWPARLKLILPSVASLVLCLCYCFFFYDKVYQLFCLLLGSAILQCSLFYRKYVLQSYSVPTSITFFYISFFESIICIILTPLGMFLQSLGSDDDTLPSLALKEYFQKSWYCLLGRNSFSTDECHGNLIICFGYFLITILVGTVGKIYISRVESLHTRNSRHTLYCSMFIVSTVICSAIGLIVNIGGHVYPKQASFWILSMSAFFSWTIGSLELSRYFPLDVESVSLM